MLQRYVMAGETEPSFLMFMIITWGGEGRCGTMGESKTHRALPLTLSTIALF